MVRIKILVYNFWTLLFPLAKSTLRSVTGSRKVSLKSAGGRFGGGFGLGLGKESERDSIIAIHARRTENGWIKIYDIQRQL